MHQCAIPINSMPVVIEAGTGKILRDHVHMDRITKFNVLIYVTCGSMEIIEDEVVHHLLPGSLFYLKAGIHHWGEKSFEPGTAWYYVHFLTVPLDEQSTALDLTDDFSGMPLTFFYDEPRHLVIPKHLSVSEDQSVIDRVKKVVERTPSDPITRNIHMWQTLIETCRLGCQPIKPDLDRERIEQIKGYIDEHLADKTDMQTISELTGLSYKYISTVFKDKTGMTIKSYQTQRRIGEAVRYLEQTLMSVAEIAEETGFGDPFYFSKVFKNMKGVSPQKYRKNYQPRL